MNDLWLCVTAGLGSAVAFGAGDYAGGLATKREPAVKVIALSHLLALLLFLLLALMTGEVLSDPRDLMWGALAGLAGVVGLQALYRGLALGPMGVVASTSAVIGALLPVLISVLLGQHLQVTQWVGVALACVGVTLITQTQGGGRGGLPLAVVAGLGFGLFFVFLGQTQEGAVFWPLVAARLTSASLMLLASRKTGLRTLHPVPILVASVLDGLGNLLFVVAAQTGRVGNVSRVDSKTWSGKLRSTTPSGPKVPCCSTCLRRDSTWLSFWISSRMLRWSCCFFSKSIPRISCTSSFSSITLAIWSRLSPRSRKARIWCRVGSCLAV